MKILVAVLLAGALGFGGGCKKQAPVAATPAATNQMEQAAAPAFQPQPAAPRQNPPAPAAVPVAGTPKKLPAVP